MYHRHAPEVALEEVRQSRPRRPGRGTALIAMVVLFLVALALPAPLSGVPDVPTGAARFFWNRDSLWHELEEQFARQRAGGCAEGASTSTATKLIDVQLRNLRTRRVDADDPALDRLEAHFFNLAPLAATCRTVADTYIGLQTRMRDVVKWQSESWDLTSRQVRDRLYRALYGSRAALEEVMLQHRDSLPSLTLGPDVPSATPLAASNGVMLHSGDILVSRGGYPTSSLIARGNDYPGNFSHIALVHVDSVTSLITVVEAHISRGVAIGTPEQYLADKKRRVMVLRLRPDLPALLRDPMLPHRAATNMLMRARTEHIPYDFTMDYEDSSRLFCSEVASSAYRELGIRLWTGISTISAPGLRRWLASFGVRQFETQEPSDLEYDPQLSVVAEWRDATALFEDHMDNAVTDAMLEGAERGDALTFSWYSLPVARLLKAYSWTSQRLGHTGPIPEGMSPSAALRNRSYNTRHASLKEEVRREAEAWTKAHGYRPAYWTLVTFARDAVTRQ